MPTDHTPPIAPKNRLLARLPQDDYRRLSAHLEAIEMKTHLVLYESGGPIDYAYFPIGAVVSALTVMLDGNAIEVATVGKEGLVGHGVAYGAMTSPHKLIVQIGDGGLRIAASELKAEADRGGAFRELLGNYQSAFLSQISQSVACNGLHRLEQRCCRWLLMSRDRVGSDDLRLTHEYLGIMLGSRRASVTEVLKTLQEAGLVSSNRGRIIILDGKGLENRSCECYKVVREEYDRLLGGP